MRTLYFSLAIILSLFISSLGMAQVPDILSVGKSPQLKTNIVGCYPQEVWEYNWMVEFWMLYQTKNITYTSFGKPSEIKIVGSAGDSRTLYTYNTDHLLTQALDQNKVGESWVDNRREITEYAENQMASSHIIETWNGSGWTLNFGTQYIFTLDGEYLAVVLIKIWDRESGDWINSSRTSFSYVSGEMNVGESITEMWLGDAWINSYKTRYVYRAGGSDFYMSGWVDGAWVESTKMVYEFGVNESTTMTMYSGPGNGTWTPVQRFIDSNDSHGNTILTTIEFYTTEWQMLSGSKYLLTYDGNNLTERITQMYSPFEPGMAGAASSGGWENSYREVFQDFASLSTLPLLQELVAVQYYPNPAREEVKLNINNLKNTHLTISIMSLTGQVSSSEQIYVPDDEYRHTIDLRKLPSGTFIIMVKDESGRLVSSSSLIHQK